MFSVNLYQTSKEQDKTYPCRFQIITTIQKEISINLHGGQALHFIMLWQGHCVSEQKPCEECFSAVFYQILMPDATRYPAVLSWEAAE